MIMGSLGYWRVDFFFEEEGRERSERELSEKFGGGKGKKRDFYEKQIDW